MAISPRKLHASSELGAGPVASIGASGPLDSAALVIPTGTSEPGFVIIESEFVLVGLAFAMVGPAFVIVAAEFVMACPAFVIVGVEFVIVAAEFLIVGTEFVIIEFDFASG